MCCTHPYVIVATDVNLPALVWMKYQLSSMFLVLNAHSTLFCPFSYCFMLFGFFLRFVRFYNSFLQNNLRNCFLFQLETLVWCLRVLVRKLEVFVRKLEGLVLTFEVLVRKFEGLVRKLECLVRKLGGLCGTLILLIKTTLQITMLRVRLLYRPNNCSFFAFWMKTTLNDFEMVIQCAECVFVCCFLHFDGKSR